MKNMFAVAAVVLVLTGFAQAVKAQDLNGNTFNLVSSENLVPQAPLTVASQPVNMQATVPVSTQAYGVHSMPAFNYSTPGLGTASISLPVHPPACACAGPNLPPGSCGFEIIHKPGCAGGQQCTPILNECSPPCIESVECPYYECCKEFTACVEAPRVVCCKEESFKFGKKDCTFKCCDISVCVRTHRVLDDKTKCIPHKYPNIKLRVCKVKNTGLYDLYAYDIPGLPKEIVLLHDVPASQIQMMYPQAPLP